MIHSIFPEGEYKLDKTLPDWADKRIGWSVVVVIIRGGNEDEFQNIVIQMFLANGIFEERSVDNYPEGAIIWRRDITENVF